MDTTLQESIFEKSPSPRHKAVPRLGSDEGCNAATSDTSHGKKSNTFNVGSSKATHCIQKSNAPHRPTVHSLIRLHMAPIRPASERSKETIKGQGFKPITWYAHMTVLYLNRWLDLGSCTSRCNHKYTGMKQQKNTRSGRCNSTIKVNQRKVHSCVLFLTPQLLG